MNPKCYFLYLRLCNKGYSLVGKTRYYASKTGIKVFNRRNTDQVINEKNTVVLEFNPSELLLGVDGLKDQYSLIGTGICESPHYDLMLHSKSGSLDECDYIKRERTGTLDGRDIVYYNDAFHLESYNKLKQTVNEGRCNPVTVYTIQGKHYIADGKHRAAYLAFFSQPIICREVRLSPSTLNYMKNIYNLMMKEPTSYSKNIDLIEKIFSEYKEDVL